MYFVDSARNKKRDDSEHRDSGRELRMVIICLSTKNQQQIVSGIIFILRLVVKIHKLNNLWNIDSNVRYCYKDPFKRINFTRLLNVTRYLSSNFSESRVAARCERLNRLFIRYGRARTSEKKQLVPLSCLIEPTLEPNVHETAKALEKISRSSGEQSIAEEKRSRETPPLVDKQPWTCEVRHGTVYTPITRSFTEAR